MHKYGEQTTTDTFIDRTLATLFRNLTSTSGATVNFEALWSENTDTPYVVYHYVKIVWQNAYTLSQTETRYGTTDSTLVFSWLAKTWFVCVHYRRWSLTWTELWPGEVVTQTTIRWDGSTKIYLYYDRDSHMVILSGDAHVAQLMVGEEETQQAVRECGSEVPVNAIPKPWYHFVRWDREERTEEEWERDNESS